MNKRIQKITNELLYRIQQPTKSTLRYIIRDSLVSGFSVTVSSRSMSFALELHHQGKRKRLTIGKFPFVDAIQARQQALALLVQDDLSDWLKEQQNVSPQAAQDLESDETLAELIKRYAKIRQLKDRTLSDIQSLCRRYLPDYLEQPAQALTKAHCLFA